MAFPTLSVNPSKIRLKLIKRTLRNEMEDGTVIARPLDEYDWYHVHLEYNDLDPADVALLKAHFKDVGGDEEFSWTHPLGTPATALTVRFANDELEFETLELYDESGNTLEAVSFDLKGFMP